MSYPGPHDRHGLFALDFIRVLNRAQAVTALNPSGLALVTAVVIAEHDRDYLSPPDFWNSQLKLACGLHDDDAFAACRSRCMRAGWLVYVPGPARVVAGRYWVQVPAALQSLIGRPSQSPIVGAYPRSNRYKTPDKTPAKTRDKTPAKTPPNTPDKTPVLPHQGQGQGGGSALTRPTAPTPPGSDSDEKTRNRKALAKTLRRCGLSAAGDAVDEWSDLALGLGGCTAAAAVIDCVAWIADQALKRKIPLRFAREAKDLAIEYANKGPG